MEKGWAAVAAALAIAAPAAASAQLVTASDPRTLVEIIKAEGYRATLGKDAEGDPLITLGVEGYDSYILFYGCENGVECDNVMFQIGFNMPEGTTPDVINAWNRDNFVGAAWLDDENDPFVNYFVALQGGTSKANFAAAVDWWANVVRNFRDHVGF